jgi:hypothetical protein
MMLLVELNPTISKESLPEPEPIIHELKGLGLDIKRIKFVKVEMLSRSLLYLKKF